MFHRINKAQPATWLDGKTMQIGLGDSAQLIENVDTATAQIISALYSGIVSGQESVLESTLNIPSGKTSALINQLSPIIENHKQVAFGSWNDLAFAEIARASLDYQVNGEMVMAERWQRVVHIDQLDKTGLLLAKALLASGVGKIITHDAGVVLKTDLGELGYPLEKLGMKRTLVANEIVNELSLVKNSNDRIVDLNLKPFRDIAVSFAVTVGHLALSPRTYSRWLRRDVSHLAITYHLDGATVSPIVRPGETACLNCIQESIVDSNESWPIIASQLLDLPRVRDDAAALLTVSGLSSRSILRCLDQQAGFEYKQDLEREFSLGYEIQYSTGTIRQLKYELHKLCSCKEFMKANSDSD